ncbi:MAG: integrase [Afipia broomeae]|jgi:integrase|uniref:Tyrosine-type recombinase/integrase n=1 Tax=Candidatus Afipia apatlaquensis TaxID=2712852 RepID=A0A7C9VQA2_9BRAD|nr:tyrosine-type recombinase/integrase [Afipia sp.]NGX97593.1 tyrosine-type recombinase/integrase [Candidatus Afipia apatlaquensis]RTL75988.1 MAG: site-specific integrase [Bradyrhizobiaceae bacterium]
MAREINRLSARTVKTVKELGRHADGNGLYLSVSANGGRRWVFLYRLPGRVYENGKPKLFEMGLGSASNVSLKEAREAAEVARKQLREGLDPLQQRGKSSTKTFSECATEYIALQESGWRNPKHREQWKNTLATYADPKIGKLPVDAVTVDNVLDILKPLWSTKTETASRVRGRIEAILDWAAAHKYRSAENPARWRGHLNKVLPAMRKVAKVQHHPALPFRDIPTFMTDLRSRDGTAAKALEFTILTAARTGETIGAKWDEIDFKEKVWTVSAERMKAGVEHQVPLSDRAIEILADLSQETDYVFPGQEIDKPLSNMAMLALLKRMNRSDLTVHGFRSTFRDWAAETTEYPNELVEMALAHTIKNKAEAAYRRGNLLDRRRALMQAWANFCMEISADASP